MSAQQQKVTAVRGSTDDVLGKLHRASCIVRYVAESALDNDEVGLGETLKAAEELVLQAMMEIKVLKS